MSINELLAAIGARGIQLGRNGDELLIRGDSAALDPAFISAMREAKTLLLKQVSCQKDEWWSPSFTILPEMLPLVQLKAEEIERVVSKVPGGASNIQDIYPLAPLQEGILFHHLRDEGADPYVVVIQTAFDSRARLDAYLQAMQAVVDRHDILRTAVMWQGLPEPVQVVWRRATVPVEEVELEPDAGDAAQQLYANFNPRQRQMDLGYAPLLRIYIAYDPAQERWLLMHLQHHITMDHGTYEMMQDEIEAYLLGKADALPVPLPFRNFVAQARLGVSQQEHESYFRQLLGSLDEPTAPFGLLNVQGDGSGIEETRLQIDAELARRVRERARKLEVSTASLFHVAWAQVLAKISRCEDVVFGTLLVGRMQGNEGSARAMGLFINTLPVRLRVDEQESEAVVRGAHLQLAELLWHEHASLALAQRCSAVPWPMPLFSALLNYRHSRIGRQARSEEQKRAREGMQVFYLEERTNYPCTLTVDDVAEGFWLTAQVQSPIEPMRICDYMHTALASLTDALEQAPDRAIGRLKVLPGWERERVLYEWNETGVEYPREKCVHELLEEQAGKTPEAVAVVCGEEELSYGELNRRANQLAHYLRELGVKPEERVGICVERSVEMVVGVVGVLKAGGAYVPLDPAYPAERLRYMIEDSAPVVLLTQGHLEKWWAGMGDSVRVLDLGSASPPWREHAESSPARDGIGADPQHLAYVIYTSGSTGTPKGVMVTHRNVVGLVRNTSYVDFAPLLTIGHLSNPAFDAATFEVWGALLNGCRLAVIPRFDVLEPEKLAMQLQNLQVSTLFLTTALFNECIRIQPDMFHGMEQILFGGERCDPQSIRQGLKKSPQRGLFHVYGPTETTTFATCFAIESVGERGTVPIGRPLANTRIYILDGQGVRVGVGVVGVLFTGGCGVARGYWKRPELTAEKFLEDPFREDGKGRMYRTGDLGRWLGYGDIEFVGRNDFQVKVRGYRIELGEIEARLAEREGVGEAVVVAREDTVGDKRLVAYYTRGSGGGGGAVAGAFGGLAAGVHGAGGVRAVGDAAADGEREAGPEGIAAPEGDAYVVREYEEPEGEMEESLAGIWAEVLHVERVGRQDNFFELGGHSLLAVRVIARVREALKVEVGIRDLFAHSVLSDLAGVLENAAPTELSPIVAVERGVGLPLSFAQQRLWFLAQMEGVSEAYHMPMGWGLKGGLDRAALRKALDRIVARHEALRTRFALVEGEPVQRIEAREESRFHLVEHDLRGRSDAVEELARLGAEEAEASFDLEAGPLIRGRLVRLGEEEDALLITMHHIVSDGWSMGVFRKELSRLYGAFLRGEADPLAELEIQYADYAVWQRNWIEGEMRCRSMRRTGRRRWPEVRFCWSCRQIIPASAQQDFAGGW